MKKKDSSKTKKVCESCRLTYNYPYDFCANCGKQLIASQTSDEWLKSFIQIDDATLKRFKQVRDQTIKEAAKRGKRKGPLKAIGISGSARDEFDSAAEASNSEFLLSKTLEELQKLGVKTELIPLRKYSIKPCKACYSTTNTQCHFYCSCYPKGTPTGDDMSNELYDKILDADIIIFATPVNNFKISSYMALFLDRCISLDGSLPPADPTATKDKGLNIKHTKFVELMADQSIPGSGFYRRFMGKTAGIIATGHEEGAAMAISSLYMTLSHYGMAFPPWSNVYAMSSVLNATYKDKNIVESQAYVDDVKELAYNTFIMAKNLRKLKTTEWQEDYSAN